MRSIETIVRRAAYGLELTDALTGGALIGTSSVQVTPVSPSALAPTSFVVNRSRWVFEDLDVNAVFDVSAENYLSQSLTTGTSIPAVPSVGDPGIIVDVPMLPRTGYPFPSLLTRVTGVVRLAGTVDPTTPVVPNAKVVVTPTYSISPLVQGPSVETKTADDGQYVMWFLPDPTFTPATPVAFDAHAEATVVIGGVSTFVQGDITNQPLAFQTANGADPIPLAP